ncbi:MAG TPA: dTMP kinase [Thermoplasmata archaeon]|nr:dTMP kinase [Thermoplasmata archaeon]
MHENVKEVEGPFFIVIEGIDGSGKGTQARYLYDFVKRSYPHLNPVLTSEPTKGAVGKIVREYLKEDGLEPEVLALLFAADRLHHVCETIVPNLKKGRCVISERYVYSSLVYQSVSGVDLRWLTEINRYSVIPDLVVYLSVPVSVARRRVAERLEKERKKKSKRKKNLEFFEEKFLTFQEDVAKAFESLLKGEMDVKIRSGGSMFDDFGKTNFVEVDGSKIPKIVHHHLIEVVDKLFSGRCPRLTNKYDYSLFPSRPSDIFKLKIPWLKEFINTRKTANGRRAIQKRLF